MCRPFVDPANDPIDVLLYRGKGVHVDTVMVNGLVAVEGGKVLTIDEEALSARLVEAASMPRTEKEKALVQVMDELQQHVIGYYAGWPEKLKAESFFQINSRL
jgi:5-methylthioadenosine/S-adenosylhomocysteine deaminase